MTKQQVAELLLHPLFRCLDPAYKVRYSRNIWEQFEGGIRSAAYTDQLPVFLTKIQRKLPITLRKQFDVGVLQVIDSGQDTLILDMLREHTNHLTLLTRIAHQRLKDEQ